MSALVHHSHGPIETRPVVPQTRQLLLRHRSPLQADRSAAAAPAAGMTAADVVAAVRIQLQQRRCVPPCVL